MSISHSHYVFPILFNKILTEHSRVYMCYGVKSFSTPQSLSRETSDYLGVYCQRSTQRICNTKVNPEGNKRTGAKISATSEIHSVYTSNIFGTANRIFPASWCHEKASGWTFPHLFYCFLVYSLPRLTDIFEGSVREEHWKKQKICSIERRPFTC